MTDVTHTDNDMNEITFKKATLEDKNTIFSWLAEPHIQEFWDNTQAHKDDIINFMEGRTTPSAYADGKYVYWVARQNDQPFALLMTIMEITSDDINEIKLDNLSKTGHTYGLDYMIGDKNYFGKGYGAKTITVFLEFFRKEFDSEADVFMIDPASDNPKAKHVYMKAGFKHIADFVMSGDCSGAGKPHHLLIKRFQPKILLTEASINEYPFIQNMARFYVYDLSRYCGHISSDWSLPKDGLYESFDFKNYFEETTRKAYLIKVYDEVAGFVLLNQVCTNKSSDWNLGEFFIIAKFQGCGVGKQTANRILDMHPGVWEVSVIPENKPALFFWLAIISNYTKGEFTKEEKLIDFDKDQPQRIVFTFDTDPREKNGDVAGVEGN